MFINTPTIQTHKGMSNSWMSEEEKEPKYYVRKQIAQITNVN